MVQVDYFYLKKVKDGEIITCLSAVDSVFRSRKAMVIDSKGGSDSYAVKLLKTWGRR